VRYLWLRIPAFVIVLVALFVWAGEVVSGASGNTRRVPLEEGISVANGEIIFWGPGKCHTCHAIGTRGSAVRGPNLGGSADGDAMMVRAESRARERSVATGGDMTASDYLVESLVSPGVHLVEGYKDEMPVVYLPPINLDPEELASVVLYLQSLGGLPDAAAITLPPDVRRSHLAAADENPWEPYLEGDSVRGRELFFDPAGAGNCAGCHRVGDEGGEIGPELTSVAGTRTIRSIVESIVAPGEAIPAGYEMELIETVDGQILDGLVVRETTDSLWLASALGEVRAIAAGEVARRRVQDTSLMPEDLVDILTVRQLHDLVAYLGTLE
jgi:putative heme-binding domain-containing protein